MARPTDTDQTALAGWEEGTHELRTDVANASDLDCDWDDDSDYVYIGRAADAHMNNTEPGERGWLGNPYKVGRYDREDAIEKFRLDFAHKVAENKKFHRAVVGIRGKTLVCWCKPDDCHGDVIREYVDQHRGRKSYLNEVDG